MADASVRIYGTREVQAKLREIARSLRDARAVEAVLTVAWLPGMNRVKELAPYKSGTLRRSYHTEPTGRMTVGMGTDVEYAPPQEYGTVHMAARPHFRPGLEQAKPDINREIEAGLEQLVKKALR